MPEIIFRADASDVIGSGHVMRCLTLASALGSGHKISFVSREIPGNLIRFVEKKGFAVTVLGANDPEQLFGTADLVVVDHYGIGSSVEKGFRSHARKVAVIDDLMDKKHDCDLLLNQNPGFSKEKYRGLVSPGCRLLVGPDFALIRPEFKQSREQARIPRPSLKNAMVFFGGSDLGNESEKTVRALLGAPQPPERISLVLGSQNERADHLVKAFSAIPAVEVLVQTDKMALLTLEADAFFGAGGSASWERACLGLPSAIAAVAQNQVPVAEALAHEECILYLGEAAALTENDWQGAIVRLQKDAALFSRLSKNSAALVDGEGTTRVVAELELLLNG